MRSRYQGNLRDLCFAQFTASIVWATGSGCLVAVARHSLPITSPEMRFGLEQRSTPILELMVVEVT